MRPYCALLLLALCPASAPAAAPSPADLDALFAGSGAREALRAGDAPALKASPAAPQDKINVDAIMKELYKALDIYATEATTPQIREINNALFVLQATEAGRKLCLSLARECSYQALKDNDIEIRYKTDLPPSVLGEAVDQKYSIGYKKLLVLTPAIFDRTKYTMGDMAGTLAHEMSHLQDISVVGSSLSRMVLATEQKAMMTRLLVQTQLMHNKADLNNAAARFMMEYWRYKEEGGPFPVTGLMRGSDAYPPEKLVKLIEPAADGRTGLLNFSEKFLYMGRTFAEPENTREFAARNELRNDYTRMAQEYRAWRVANGLDKPAYYAPVTPPSPGNGQGGSTTVVVSPPPGGGNHTPPPPPGNNGGTQPPHPANPVTPPPPGGGHTSPPIQPPVTPVTPPPPPPGNSGGGDQDNGDDGLYDGGWHDVGPDNPIYPGRP